MFKEYSEIFGWKFIISQILIAVICVPYLIFGMKDCNSKSPVALKIERLESELKQANEKLDMCNRGEW